VLASRRPRHPVGWLLLGFALSLTASGVINSYVTYGLVVRPGALPAADLSARVYGPLIYLSLAIIGFVLLLTPTGSPPTRRWRWWGRVSTGALAVVLVAATVAPGSLDPVRMTVRGPLDPLCYGGALRAANVLAQAVAVLIILAGGGSLVVRYRRARGLERLQLRWVTLAAALTGVAMVAYGVLLALGSRLADWFSAGATTFLPLAAGAAILRYRLYDLDRIVSRTLAYGLLTVLLGLGYAAVVLGLGRLLGQDSSLVVAAATLAVAAAFQPARRRVQGAVDRRFNRRRHDAARIIEGFGPVCATRSTSTPSRLTCWRWSTRPCSRPRHRCGYDPKRRRERLVSPWLSSEPEGRNDRQPDDLRPARRSCGLGHAVPPWVATTSGSDRRRRRRGPQVRQKARTRR